MGLGRTYRAGEWGIGMVKRWLISRTSVRSTTVLGVVGWPPLRPPPGVVSCELEPEHEHAKASRGGDSPTSELHS